MPTYFFHLCLILVILLCSGCLGGPKVTPPEISSDRTAGPSSGGTDDSETMANGSMDAGVEDPLIETSAGAGGMGGDNDVTKQPDAEVTSDAEVTPDTGVMDDDDSGSTREP